MKGEGKFLRIVGTAIFDFRAYLEFLLLPVPPVFGFGTGRWGRHGEAYGGPLSREVLQSR